MDSTDNDNNDNNDNRRLREERKRRAQQAQGYAFIAVYDTRHLRAISARIFDWWTVAEVADYLGCNPKHCYTYIREGRLHAARLFGVTVVHRDEVTRFQHERASRARQIQRLRREW